MNLFERATTKFKREHKKIPVLIIDNANRLAETVPEVLYVLQDFAKLATDLGTATILFVSSEGPVPRRMMRKLILYSYSLIVMY